MDVLDARAEAHAQHDEPVLAGVHEGETAEASAGYLDRGLNVGADEGRGADRGAIENHATSGGGAVGQFSLCKGYFGGEACGSRLGFGDAEGEGAGFGVVELTAEAEPVEVFVERVRVARLARDVRGGSGGRRKRHAIDLGVDRTSFYGTIRVCRATA
ncbi:MAG: hypothetical protein VXY57_02515, partial [Actinomycetota bacterium]|nr:hypothetical protein [Actinomycetota bacterium]